MMLTETTKTLKLPKLAMERTIERGEVKINEKGDTNQKKIQFSEMDDFWKNEIRETINGF